MSSTKNQAITNNYFEAFIKIKDLLDMSTTQCQ